MARLGPMRHRIVIQLATETQDTYGDTTFAFAKVREVWAEVKPVSGTESFDQEQVDARITHRIRMRYFDGLTASHRIVHRSRNFHIIQVINTDERRIETIALAMEDVGN